jgi:hypothetical protein
LMMFFHFNHRLPPVVLMLSPSGACTSGGRLRNHITRELILLNLTAYPGPRLLN